MGESINPEILYLSTLAVQGLDITEVISFANQIAHVQRQYIQICEQYARIKAERDAV